MLKCTSGIEKVWKFSIIKKSQASEQNFTESESTSLFLQCCAMCKIEFHDEEFREMKRSNGIELTKFSIEKVLKKYGK